MKGGHMAFNSYIAIETIKLKIWELAEKRRAWEEEGQRLCLAQLLETDPGIVRILAGIRLECFSAAGRIREQIDELQQEVEAIEAGPSFFRPHRK